MLGRFRSLALVAGTILLGGCSSSSTANNNGGGGGSTALTVSNATPSDGNGSVTIVGIDTIEVGFATNGNKVLVSVFGTIGGDQHQLDLYVDPDDGDVPLVEHRWGADAQNGPWDGFTLCDGTVTAACDPSKITVDLAAGSIVLNGLVLENQAQTEHSTLTGTINY